LLSGPPENTSLRAGYVVLQPGKSVGVHDTEMYEEMIVVFEGAGSFQSVGNDPLPFQGPCAVYCPPHTRHDVVNTGLSDRPGVGGLVTSDAIDRMQAETLSQNYAVWIEDGADRDATLASLRQAFDRFYFETSTPSQVTNLGLVSGQPAILALVIAVLAGAALIHALVTSVRGSRRQIGVLKSVGFTNRQVVSMVAWHASLLSAGALVIGIPLGIIAGRVIWRAIVGGLGRVSAPALPVGAVVAVVVVVLAVANLAALGPGWAAARTRPASALRTE
jgi:ABC-type lipoprotein release transport system permease subunit